MLRVCVIGAGNIAKTIHLPFYYSNPNTEIVGISDLSTDSLSKIAEEFKIPSQYHDYLQMLDELKPDLVSICTPNKFHFIQSMAALERGIHVFCEKPPAMNYLQLKQMYELSQKNNCQIAFNFHHRFRQETLLLKEWVQNREKKDIYFAEIIALRRRGIPGWGNFTNKSLQGGGALIDIGIHMLDLFLFVMNYPIPKYVIASASNRIGIKGGTGDFGEWNGSKFEVEDSLFGQITFEGGLTAQIRTAFAHNFDVKSDLNVTIYASDEGAKLHPFTRYGNHDPIIIPIEESLQGLSSLPHFVSTIISGNHSSITDIKTVLWTQRITDALYLSAEMNQPIKVENLDVSL